MRVYGATVPTDGITSKINKSTDWRRMSDHEIELSLVQIALRVGFACAVTVMVVAGSFFFVRFLAGHH